MINQALLETLFPHADPTTSLSYRLAIENMYGGKTDGIRHVLEWGPGRSTAFLLEYFPNAKVHAIEHDSTWFNKAVKVFGQEDRVALYLKCWGRVFGNNAYVTFPIGLGLSFDFALVDGRQRIDCAVVASLLIKRGGVVFIHDYEERQHYKEVEQFFGRVEVRHNTGVLSEPLRRLGDA